MATASTTSWTIRGATFALWALAAGSAAFWALRFSAPPAAPQARPLAERSSSAMDPAAVARFLGASPAPLAQAAAPVASLASRFSLVGVAARPSGGGTALISVDAKPARPYRVGAMVEEGLVLQSVGARVAVLGATPSGPPVLTLEMPQVRR